MGSVRLPAPAPEEDAGDLVLRDSSVICQLLESEHPKDALFLAGHEAWVKALWLEEHADGTLFPSVVHGLCFQKGAMDLIRLLLKAKRIRRVGTLRNGR